MDDVTAQRVRQIAEGLLAEERERAEEWEASRAGHGVTPGAADVNLKHLSGAEVVMSEDRAEQARAEADLCDFVPDTSILGQAANPKELAATRDKKAPLHLLEYVADCEIAAALSHGAHKYGRKNFQQTPILANVYGGAMRRHIGAWLSGEDIDPESGLPHLAHVGANIHVLFAAMAYGTFVDDRGPEEQSDVQARLSAASNRARP